MLITPKTIELLKTFMIYAVKELGLKQTINLKLVSHGIPGLHTAGCYDPHDDKITVVIKNRALADIFRTVAHELTHQSQAERGDLDREKGEYNQDLEDEANYMSGRLVRFFGQDNNGIYDDIT